MRFCLRFGTDGWYCSTKGKIHSFSFHGFSWRVSFLSLNFTSQRVFRMIFSEQPWQPLSIKYDLKVLIFVEIFSQRRLFLELYIFEPFIWWNLLWLRRMGWGEMYMLKCLSRLEVCMYTKNWVIFLSLTFRTLFPFQINFSVGWWLFQCLFNQICYFHSVYSSQ